MENGKRVPGKQDDCAWKAGQAPTSLASLTGRIPFPPNFYRFGQIVSVVVSDQPFGFRDYPTICLGASAKTAGLPRTSVGIRGLSTILPRVQALFLGSFPNAIAGQFCL